LKDCTTFTFSVSWAWTIPTGIATAYNTVLDLEETSHRLLYDAAVVFTKLSVNIT
jgi:hypothetical protein